MGCLSKSFSLLIILILAASSIIMVEPAFAQSVPTPSFSVTYVDSNPPAVVLTIQNVPFTSYVNANDKTVSLFFNMRVRYGGGDWGNITDPSDNGYPMQVGNEKTVITFTYSSFYGFYKVSQDTPGLMDSEAALPPGYKIDFQLETMIGYIGRNMSDPWLFYAFYGSTSDWSPIQTLFVPDPSATPAPTPTPSPTLTPSPTPTPTITGFFMGSNATLLATVVIVAVIAIGAGLIVYFKKRKR